MKEYKTSGQILKEKKLYNDEKIKSDAKAVDDTALLNYLLREATSIVDQQTFYEELNLIQSQKIYKYEDIESEFFTTKHRDHLIDRTLKMLEFSEDKKRVQENKQAIIEFLYKEYKSLINTALLLVKNELKQKYLKVELIKRDKKEVLETVTELQETILLYNNKLHQLIKEFKNYNKTKYLNTLISKNNERYKIIDEVKEKAKEFEKWTSDECGYYTVLLKKTVKEIDEEMKNINIELEKIDKNDEKWHTISAVFNVIMYILLFTVLLPIGLLLLGCGWATKKK